ncbi:hypothetical protein KCP78_05110 [Salmonella enterica subsp. enterica]|nr:hypothetical protein KCP78_05110 [Salmonella enterica subsp. enterica]
MTLSPEWTNAEDLVIIAARPRYVGKVRTSRQAEVASRVIPGLTSGAAYDFLDEMSHPCC